MQIICYLLNYYLGILIYQTSLGLIEILFRAGYCAFTSYRDVGNNTDKNLSKDEQFALSTLIKSKDLVIQKADKGNTVVILNKKDYNLKMKKILSDTSKFHKLSIDQNKLIILSIWKIELFLF